MSDETMVERVAAAIWALQRDTDCNDYAKLTKSTKALADEMGRAAIAAWEAALREERWTISRYKRLPSGQVIPEIYPGIDAALAEKDADAVK